MINPNGIKFPRSRIRLKKIYQSNDSQYHNAGTSYGSKIQEVYGDFSLPLFPDDRAYTLGSFVQSIDGKIAFPESPDGTLVAKGNTKDPDGALTDYWILNMLRSVSDAVLMGSKAISKEPELTGRIFDQDLVSSRINRGQATVPLHIIVTGSGTGFPENHIILKDPDIPVLIATTERGKDNLRNYMVHDFMDLNITPEENLKACTKAVISCGNNKTIKIPGFLAFLKKHGIDSVLIESPGFLVSLMKESLLDELYLNTSSLFIGGDALSIGRKMDSFSFKSHPYGKVISLHTHSDYFFFTRYRMEYDS